MEDNKNDFYATFSSKDGLHIFPDNIPARFKIQLPTALQLAEGYYCALMELHFPSDFYNIHSNECEFRHINSRLFVEGIDVDNIGEISVINFENDKNLSFVDNLERFFTKYNEPSMLTMKFSDSTKATINMMLNKEYRLLLESDASEFFKYLFGMSSSTNPPIATLKLPMVNYYKPEYMEKTDAASYLIFPAAKASSDLKWRVNV